MKKSATCILALLLSMALVSGCGGNAGTNDQGQGSDTSANGQAQGTSAVGQEPGTSAGGKTADAFLTVDEARKKLQSWTDTHPFQLGGNIEAESDEYEADGVTYYRFYLGIVRLGIAEILVDKETGDLYHLTSPYATVEFAPIDDWYEKDHAGYADDSPLTADEARALLQAWLDEHPLQPPVVIAKDYEEHSIQADVYYLFTLDSEVDYWPMFLVHQQTKELFLAFGPDDLLPTGSLWSPDDWYNEHFGNASG